VKPVVFLIAFASTLKGDLVATFQTTQGNVVVSLQYQKAPQAVANFITLAQGTRKRLDPLSGAVIDKPLYIGEKFFRVLNDPGFRIAQTGSGTGTNSGGPGYTFRDEFDPSLTHVPYVLSMANSGPDSNGSQIFLTGNATIPGLDNVHTIFGLIADPASRVVIDAIHAAGNNGTTITGVTFFRTDPAAVAFDEHAQNLPVCSGHPGQLLVTPGVEAKFSFGIPQPAGSVLQGFRSPNLQSWSKLGEIYQGTGLQGFGNIVLDAAALPRAFYNIPLVTYPDALGPASTANRTLVVGLFGTQTMTIQFDATGQAGTVVYSQSPAQTATILGVDYSPSVYKATWIIETDLYAPLRFQGSLESQNQTHVFGTNLSQQWNGAAWGTLSSGSLSLTK
jgi:peptidyl-prolyl cis-trans isomerase A (cyclophilin A)